MASKLNIEGLPNERKLYALGNGDFIIKTTHSPVCGWVLSIYNKDEEPLITGISLISEPRNLTWRYHSRLADSLFEGDLFLLKSSDSVEDLSFNNFSENGDWNLVYLSRSEMDSLGIY